ncbi:MoaF C-terminal domain-containing protein [Paraburkholderia acidiphila]|uniref:Molybdenum cofactor biosynthesis protein F n=1 Tax=Paraburkholderia acidiphila TaxID=2571747 RepID=A0A7Z2G880_9BURK|nr:MoaF C-terminal domain-containing protein [Paraburkholderia acidiphila]QGZ56906.1 molybdenum cofactor biosynthesis protein F [Paraburkholderia acidiphila]
MSNKYMPGTRWPQISDIVVNHDGGRPDPVRDLRGQSFSLAATDGHRLDLRFHGDGVVYWTSKTVPQYSNCEVFLIRPRWYFVDFLDAASANRSHSIVLDTVHCRALHVEVLAPADDVPAGLLDRITVRGTQSAVDVRIWQGSWNANSLAFERTDSLVGRHYRYHYSETHIYDHIYLSERHYSWFCHRGPDAGLGDFEECDYFQLGDDLFFVCWKEKLIPCVGVTVEDLASMRSIGKIFGADAYTGETANRTVGSSMSLISTFSRP